MSTQRQAESGGRRKWQTSWSQPAGRCSVESGPCCSFFYLFPWSKFHDVYVNNKNNQFSDIHYASYVYLKEPRKEENVQIV